MSSLVHSGLEAVVPTDQAEKPAKHTPAPWIVNPFAAQVECSQMGAMGGLLPVAAMLWPTTERSEQETGANARLIAAAPELLEALDRALAALQRLHTDVEALMADSEGVAGLHHNGDVAKWDDLAEGGPFSDWVGDPLRAARNAWHDGRAAIAKATGEAAT